MGNKRRKLFVIEQSKWCKFMPKMHQNTLGGRVPPGPAGEFMRSPNTLSAWDLRLYIRGGREGERGEGPTSKGSERRGLLL